MVIKVPPCSLVHIKREAASCTHPRGSSPAKPARKRWCCSRWRHQRDSNRFPSHCPAAHTDRQSCSTTPHWSQPPPDSEGQEAVVYIVTHQLSNYSSCSTFWKHLTITLAGCCENVRWRYTLNHVMTKEVASMVHKFSGSRRYKQIFYICGYPCYLTPANIKGQLW